MTDVNQFLEQLDGDLSPEDAAKLLDLAMGESANAQSSVPDTDAKTDDTSAAVPAESTDETQGQSNQTQQPSDDQLTDENAILMAKDGKHTIPFQKLVDARERASIAAKEVADANAKIAELEAKLAQQATPTEQQQQQSNMLAVAQNAINEQGVDPEIFGDFSEAALAKGIQTLVDQRVAAQVAAVVDEKLKTALAPLEQQKQLNAVEQHYKTIYDAHPDADSIVESKELGDWIQSQPSYAQAAINDAIDKGTAQQIVEVLNHFKQSSGQTSQSQPQQQGADLKAKAKAALQQAQAAPPTSLTDIAGKPGAAATDTEKFKMSDNGIDALQMLEGKTPEQIEALLNRTL